jgi:hypothetical protein
MVAVVAKTVVHMPRKSFWGGFKINWALCYASLSTLVAWLTLNFLSLLANRWISTLFLYGNNFFRLL